MEGAFSKRILTVSLALALLLGLAPPMQSGRASTASGDFVGETLRQEALEAYLQLPLYFIANQGQRDESVAYYVQGGGHSIYFAADQVVLALRHGSGQALRQGPSTSLRTSSGQALRQGPSTSLRTSSGQALRQGPSTSLRTSSGQALRHGSGQALGETVLRVRFVGAEATQPVGAEERAARVNYLVGNDPVKWRTDIPTYGKVNYRELYPGIDLRYGGQTGALKYTFVVGSGADVSQIRLTYEGADGLQVDETGDLLILVAGRALRDTRPYAYQEIGGRRVEVDVAFTLHDLHTCGFVVGDYDPHYPLVIDPTLDYSTFLGGNDDDQGYGIAVDGDDNVYVTGMTWSTDFATRDAYQKDQGYGDAFVAKIDTTKSGAASLVYSTYLGGSGAEWGNDIAVDGDGNAYVTGITMSADFPFENGFQIGTNYATVAFVTKINAAGNGLLYSTCMGFRGGVLKGSEGNGIAVGGDGNAYVTGFTEYPDFHIQNAYQETYGGEGDAFVARIDTTKSGAASLVYSTYLGGSARDWGYDIAVDGAGNAYVAGETYSTDFPTKNACQGDQGGWDAFVAKIDATQSGYASLVYSTYLGGGGNDHGQGVAVDGAGNAYVTGYTYSTNFPTQSAYQVANAGNSDAFATQLNPSGNALVYSTYLGGNSWDEGRDIALDGAGNAYVTGKTHSTDFPTQKPYQAANAGDNDAFATQLNAAGNAVLYSTYLGGSGDDCGQSIALDGNGNAYVTGKTHSTADFPTRNAYQGAYGGGDYDAFVAKFGPDRFDLSTSNKQVSPAIIEPTGTVTHTLHYTITLANTGNLTATTACLTDTLPSGLNLTVGPACSGGTCGYNPGHHIVTWTGSLTPGASAVIIYSGLVSVPIGTEDTIYFVNTAQVDDGTNAPFALEAWSAVNPRYIYLPIVLRNF